VFTQDFFTENATHRQNCTSFNPKRVITYNVNNGKPFLNMSRSVAQIIEKMMGLCAIMYLRITVAVRQHSGRIPASVRFVRLYYPSLSAWVLPTARP
jgi:hypothetical protein